MFYRIARFVRDTIKLHVSLAAGEIPKLPRQSIRNTNPDCETRQYGTLPQQTPAPPARKADPRYEPVVNYLMSAIKAAPRGRCRPDTMQKLPNRLRETIEADPGHTLTGAQIAVKICKEFHLPYNIAKLNQDPILSHNPSNPPAAPAQGTGPP